MKCIHCGDEIHNKSAKFCAKCGNVLQTQDAQQQSTPVVAADFSPAAGSQTANMPNATANAAHTVPSATLSPDQPLIPAKVPKKKSKLPVILASVLVIAVLIGAAVYMLPQLLGDAGNSANINEYSKAEQKEISSILAKAENLAEQENYNEALVIIYTGLSNYPDDETLQKKAQEYTLLSTEQEKANILAEAERLAASGDYLGAMQVISHAQEKAPDDEDYSNTYDQYNRAHVAQIKQEAINEADAYAKAGDYLSALTVIDTTISRCGNDETLKKLLATYSDAYVAEVLVQTDMYIQNSQYDKAHALLDSAATAVPNNESLHTKQDELAQYKSVSLSSLTAINGGFAWNEGAPEDPFGNDYSTVNNYTILHGNYCSGNYTLYSEFRLSKACTELTFNYAPYSDFGENATSYIQVYVDGVLRYTTPKITRKSGLQTVQLDICDADYVEIVVKKGDHGCVLISDAMLTSTPNHVCEAKSKVSLSTLSVLNGEAPWENDYPTDNLGGTYFNSSNYIVFHGNYCSGSYTLYAEYYINGKYSTLDFSAAPYDNFDEKATSIVRVYVDDVLVYTATITGKTAKIDSGAIDLLGATYLKIVVDKNDYGCIILSNLMLTPKG